MAQFQTEMDPNIQKKLSDLWLENDSIPGQKGVPPGVYEILNKAFSKVPVSTFPDLPSGKVVEISGDATISEAVQILAKNNIMCAPVRNPNADDTESWSSRYIGMVDYPAVVLWVLEQAELAATALAAGSAAAVGVGAGALGALGAVVLGLTGPAAIAGLTAAALGAAVAGGIAADRGFGRDAPSAADAMGEDFYKVILKEEPFKSIKVQEITKSYRWAPFLPVQQEDSMLTVLLLISKYRLRSIPVIEENKPFVENVITQSAVVKGLSQCHGRDWFDSIAEKSLTQLGLPCMNPEEVVSVNSEKLVLEAFLLMREKGIGGVPVVGVENCIVGNISLRDVHYLLLNPEIFAQRQELTVLDYITTVTSQCCKDTQHPKMIPPITCKVSTTLGEVIDILVEEQIHRIYVVSDSKSIIGVVTLRDIVSCFVSEPRNYFEEHFGGLLKETVTAQKS